MALEIITCDQGSQEWHEARRGIATASEFHAIMAKGEGKTRRTYMRKLAGEIITGAVADSYTNAAMERGKAMEAEARAAYEFAHNRQVETIGFVRNGRAGASPDGFIPGGVLEIKTKFPHLLIECFERGPILPPEHMAQVQGALWITERDRAEFVAYWPGMPLFWCLVTRDEEYIKALASEVERFNEELDAMVDRVRNWRAAA
jgi:predicted phage-related endonuclease